jgi:uncharacterized membrane protein HdeD (DUF308 family)
MNMDKQFKTGAILAIITGGLGVLAGIVIFANLHFAYLWAIVLAVAIWETALGLFSAVAGAFALKDRIWSLALAAAVVGILVFFPTGIAAVVFLGVGHKGLLQANAKA